MTQTLSPTQHAGPRTNQYRLLFSLFAANAMLFACYAAFMVIFVPNQVQVADPENKVGNLAIVMTASALAAVIIHPLVGALSDRTRSRMGRRAPWIVIGAGGGALFMLMLCLNGLGTALPTVVADRFETSRLGVASAVTSMGSLDGMGLGVVGAGVFAESIGIGYAVFGGAVLVASVAFVLFNRDFSS